MSEGGDTSDAPVPNTGSNGSFFFVLFAKFFVVTAIRAVTQSAQSSVQFIGHKGRRKTFNLSPFLVYCYVHEPEYQLNRVMAKLCAYHSLTVFSSPSVFSSSSAFFSSTFFASFFSRMPSVPISSIS